MKFNLLSPLDVGIAKHNIELVERYGISIYDKRIVSVVDNDGNLTQELLLLLCEAEEEQLNRLCEETGIEYHQEYEEAPLYY